MIVMGLLVSACPRAAAGARLPRPLRRSAVRPDRRGADRDGVRGRLDAVHRAGPGVASCSTPARPRRPSRAPCCCWCTRPGLGIPFVLARRLRCAGRSTGWPGCGAHLPDPQRRERLVCWCCSAALFLFNQAYLLAYLSAASQRLLDAVRARLTCLDRGRHRPAAGGDALAARPGRDRLDRRDLLRTARGAAGLERATPPDRSSRQFDAAMREIVQTALIVFLVSGAMLTFERLSTARPGRRTSGCWSSRSCWRW